MTNREERIFVMGFCLGWPVGMLFLKLLECWAL